MSQYSPPRNIKVDIKGGVSGQVAIGENILQIGEIHGDFVNILPQQQRPKFSKKQIPLYVRPRSFPGLLDRKNEQRTIIGTLQIPESLSLSGVKGIGKTSLLRYLAYNSPLDNFPDGIIYLSAMGYSTDDLREYIFESFYESDQPAKPTDAQLNRFLQDLKALILLDDLSLDHTEAVKLIDSAPQSVFILTSSERCLWGEGYCMELEGLPIKDALKLMERELRRSITDKEIPAAEGYCKTAHGNPLHVIKGAALVQHGMSFEQISHTLQTSEDTLVQETIAPLTTAQKQILALLAASGGIPIPTKHLQTLCKGIDLDSTLAILLDLKLIQAHSPAYSLTGEIALPLGRFIDISNWEKRLTNYFVSWVKENPPLPDITDVLNLLLSVMEKSNRDHRWDDVIVIGRKIEKALILGKRWSAWMRVLEMILKAAQAINNRAAQAWTLHQLGTHDLCMHNIDSARNALNQALKIREALGDKAGAAVTRHNLTLAGAPPVPPRDTPRSGPTSTSGGGSPFLKISFTLAALGTAAVILIGIIYIILINPPTPPSPPEPAPIITTEVQPQPPIRDDPSVTPSKTPTRTPTKTPTRTPTKTPTITITPTLTLEPCRRGVWYCENFNDGLAQSWNLEQGWSVEDEYLYGTGHHFAILDGYSWDNYRVTYNLYLEGGTIHLNYRLTPVSGGFNRYFIGVNQYGMYLSKQVGGEFYDGIVSTTWSDSLEGWHTIDIFGWNGHILVEMDGESMLEYADESYIRDGTIAFETLDYYVSAWIDNIEVTGPGDEPPYNPYPSINLLPDILFPDILQVSCTSTIITWEEKTDRPGMDYWSGQYTGGIDSVPISATKCQQMCQNDAECMAFTYDTYNKTCWLKSGKPEPVYKYETISGVRVCQ